MKKAVHIKVIMIALFLISTQMLHATGSNTGYYMGAQPYYNFGSSYYLNPGMDYYWDGDGWIFQNGYKVLIGRRCMERSTNQCNRCSHHINWFKEK